MQKFDVAVIGAGPGGYVAALRCGQLGLRTVLIDERLSAEGKMIPGGTCLNVGCIPSKALLDSSEHYARTVNELAEHGIKVRKPTLDLKTLMARKDSVVQSLTTGVSSLLMKHKVTAKAGRARLVSSGQIEITPPDGTVEVLEAANIIIATGSAPTRLAGVEQDDEFVVDSTGALSFDQVPARLGIIGTGVIALELGSVWSRLGAEVTLFQRGEVFLSAADQQLSAALNKSLVKQGLTIRTGVETVTAKLSDGEVVYTFKDKDGPQKQNFDRLLVAAGRRPHTEGLGAVDLGLNVDDLGFIVVDENCRTNMEGVWAIGDVVQGPMLAHKASEEGVAVAERIAGNYARVAYEHIPSVIYTWPELAWVGRTEQQLKQDGVEYKAGVFPFMASGRARALGFTEGMVKILAAADDDAILGVHILGPQASELIATAVLAMEYGATAEDIARTIHAHPTLAEAVHEAALAVDGAAIHI